MAEVDMEKAGVLAGLAASLLAVWRSIAANSERSKQKADERTLELFKIHVYPKLEEIMAEVHSNSVMMESVVPKMMSEVVRQTMEASVKQVFDVAGQIMKIRDWESK